MVIVLGRVCVTDGGSISLHGSGGPLHPLILPPGSLGDRRLMWAHHTRPCLSDTHTVYKCANKRENSRERERQREEGGSPACTCASGSGRDQGSAAALAMQQMLLLLLPTLLLLSHLSPVIPSHGCYWTESCQSKWLGGCGTGHVVVDQSDDCSGLCPEAKYPPCLPFHSHFRCCIPESPKITDRCTKCRNKLDFGDEYICCADCSEPSLIDKDSKLGYCKTGAELSLQLKPQETFKWVAGPWMKCSSPCDGGIRYRDVGCFGSVKDTSIRHYPVHDSRCSGEEMPARQEPCNMHSCGDLNESNPSTNKQGGMSGWLITLLVLLCLVAATGLGFAGYIFYQRRAAASSGFVYIMMQGYS